LGLPKRTLIVIAVLVGVIVLYVLGSDKQGPNSAAPGGGTAPAANATQCRVTVTADVLKVRAAPDAKSAQVGSYKQNAEIDADKLVQNGFRKLGEGKWVSNDFVKPMQGRDCG
jgi:hypothetical protein